MKTLALTVLLALTASIAPAQSKQADATVFGFRLGERLSIPECARLTKKSIIYAENDNSPCFERILSPLEKLHPPLSANETITIFFPIGQDPSMISGRTILGQLVEGNLESIGFSTRGIENQDEILASLVAKYGDAGTLTEEEKQNAFGATFDSHLAIWSFSNLSVIFQGTTDRVDAGAVNIDTPKGAAFRSALQSSEHGPKL